MKTALDIFLYYDFFKNDEILKKDVDGIVSNVIETMKQDLETNLKNKIFPVCE